MARKKSPTTNPRRQSSFSRYFNEALIVTRLTDSMVRADGWNLTQFGEAPQWLRDLYVRHANAARLGNRAVEEAQNNPKPSRYH